MYNWSSLTPKDKAHAFMSPYLPPPSPAFSTAIGTPANEDEIAAARNVLRSVISSTRQSPREASVEVAEPVASVPPLPEKNFQNRGTQTESVMPPTSLEGLIRAAGFSLANFATELKSLERRLDSQHGDILRELKNIKNKT
jgi:hypothetical protein